MPRDPIRLTGRRLPRLQSLPAEITARWPAATVSGHLISPIADRSSCPSRRGSSGGAVAAYKAWQHFLQSKLAQYPEDRNQPEADGSSGLSPYLHFGHISAHEIFTN